MVPNHEVHLGHDILVSKTLLSCKMLDDMAIVYSKYTNMGHLGDPFEGLLRGAMVLKGS